MNINIYLKVKFRAMGITFGTVEKQWRLIPSETSTVSWHEVSVDVPPHAREVLNTRGVVLRWW